MELAGLVPGDLPQGHEPRDQLSDDHDHHHPSCSSLQRNQDEVCVEEEESLQRKLKQDGQEPEASQLRHLLSEVAKIAEVETDNLDDDDGNEHSDEDKLVEIVE